MKLLPLLLEVTSLLLLFMLLSENWNLRAKSSIFLANSSSSEEKKSKLAEQVLLMVLELGSGCSKDLDL